MILFIFEGLSTVVFLLSDLFLVKLDILAKRARIKILPCR
jgi:hypothetical protein